MKRNKLFLFLFLFSFTGLAFAGSSVGSIITLGVAVVGMAFGVPPVWVMAATFATSIITSRLFAPNQNQGTSGTTGDTGSRQQIPPDTTTPIPIAYGSCYLGGKFVDAALTTDQKVMMYVMAISCLSENSTFTYDGDRMYYGDRLITFDAVDRTKVVSLTDTAGNVDTKINDLLYINLYTSNAAGVISGINTTVMPDVFMGPAQGLPADQQWSATNRQMNGLAFAIIRLSYSQEAGTTSLQPITFCVNQYFSGVGVTRPGDVWKDYMTNTIYGAAVPLEFIDTASADALNAYSDELITFTDYNGNPQTQPRYRISGVLDPSQSCLQNIDQIMTACDSWQRYDATSGKWSIVINKATPSSYSFDDSNLVGAITVGSVDITQMPNQVEAKFPDTTNRDQYSYVNENVPESLLLPNEPVNKQTLTFNLVNNSVQALYLANRVLEQSREDLLVTINTTYDGIQVNAGDVVDITNSYYGWTNKLFRAMQVKEYISPDGILGAQLQLIEYNAGVYDNFDITQYTPAANGNLASPNYFSALSQPNPVNIYPYISVPSFDINVAIPITGRVTYVILYYTTVATPSATDWNVLDQQTLSNGQVYASGSTITFPHYTIPSDTYYFAYVVGNNVAQSSLSPISDAFVWGADPANASSFTLTFNPATLQVPYNGTPTFAGVTCKLYGQNGLGGVDFVASQTDSDVAFINGTWRIGNSSTSGYADIVETNISVPDPTDGGTHADFGIPTAMASSPATMLVPVRYKDLAGVVHQVSPATVQYAYQTAGASANKYATGYLYQWNTATPTNPSGSSIYTWADGSMSSYTGGGSWQTSVPTNPGIPLIRLWQASKQVTDVATATTTTMSWTSGFSVADVTQNGASGIQQADAIVYQWALTIPAAPSGTSTYTWATSSFTAPSGWSTSQSASPSAGYTLWQAKVTLTDSVSATTTTISWTTSQVTAAGYVSATGVSTVSAFAAASVTLNSTPTIITTSGSTSLPPNNSWGGSTVWTIAVPTTSAGQTVWQSDGIYNPTTGNIVWNVPYIASVKFGSLSAISANLGQVTAGSITGITITGGTLRTSTSGVRVEIAGSTNALKVYSSTGVNTITIGGSNPGGILVDTTAVGTSYPAIQAYQSTLGTGTAIPAVLAQNLGDCFYGYSTSNGLGVYGIAQNSGGQNHGIRGGNAGTGGTSTSGLIGAANGYDFYADGAGTNYGPFTGAHDVVVLNDEAINIGYICVDVQCILKKNLSNTIFEVTQSSSANQASIGIMVLNNGSLANNTPAAFIERYDYVEVDGRLVTTAVMYPEYDAVKNDYQYCAINAVGEGQVYVCGESGDIAVGDLIVTSSVAGVGMKQSDNIVRNITVAKAREAVTFTDTTTPVLVACIYLCG